MVRKIGRALGAGAVLALFGCGVSVPPPAERDPTSEASWPLVNGSPDNGDPWVGWISGAPCGGSWCSCSATLIGRRTALTAAHCADEGATVQFCNYPCGSFTQCTGQCVSGIVHRYPGFNPGGGTDFDHDAAVINLSQDFTSLYGIVPRRLGAAPVDGSWIYLVGFGCTSYSNTNLDGQKRTGLNTITDIGSETIDYDDTSLAYSCPGDSGGPAFYPQTDCDVGVMVGWSESFFDLDYELTRLDTKLSWIRATAADPTVYACGQTICGDGFCQLPEDCSTCPSDCGACYGVCGGRADGTDCNDDCCTGYGVCRSGVCTKGTCCNTKACCLLLPTVGAASLSHGGPRLRVGAWP